MGIECRCHPSEDTTEEQLLPYRKMETLPVRWRNKREEAEGNDWPAAGLPSLGAESAGMCCYKQPESLGEVQRREAFPYLTEAQEMSSLLEDS